MAKSLPPPPFEIPLTDEDLILMGKIAVMWGQIDEGFNSILRWVLKLDPKVFESLLGNQMIGSRVRHLKAATPTSTRPRARDLLAEVTRRMADILPMRNAAMHGCWGRFPTDATYSAWDVGTFNHQKPSDRFYAKQLPALYRDMTAIMALLGELGMLSCEEDPGPVMYDQNKIWFAPEAPDERATGLISARGDRVVRAESKSPGWSNR